MIATTPQRIRVNKVDPRAYAAMNGLEEYVSQGNLPERLRELIKIRASQINGCAYCVNMHSCHARKAGETEQRIYALPVWRETFFFSEEERAALALTEAMTRISETQHVPDEVYEEAARHFDDATLVQLIMAIITINAWNRIGVTTKLAPAS